jgi:hypothetical protein
MISPFEMEFHPACLCWPEMLPKELAELANDIAAHGLIDAITVTAEDPPRILDGRNRVKACQMYRLEIPADKIVVHDGDPFAFSNSKNDRRRNVTDAQRRAIRAQLAALAAEQTKAGSGGDRRSDDFKSAPTDLKTDRAAKALADDIANIRAVQKHGTPEEIEKVRTGKASLRKTADAVRARKAPAQKTPVKPPEDPVDAVMTALLDDYADGALHWATKAAKLIGCTRDESNASATPSGGTASNSGLHRIPSLSAGSRRTRRSTWAIERLRLSRRFTRSSATVSRRSAAGSWTPKPKSPSSKSRSARPTARSTTGTGKSDGSRKSSRPQTRKPKKPPPGRTSRRTRSRGS